ncbi:DUF732 domain-containing protein [Couchioplanes caeruleus]|uniref:DUF732 domain-containing protein n=2 Tax=Couchioplanes caeruleus TaxID=56438 RepID=A0A1K0GRT2_9ACTN|nr:DUF732 domain-containing protein [Couchioplanes caeruleus]OJF13924.1 hypothetical protein BG844_12550 [Couchioplanes caeruleus subsp. caeruleus]ROP34378.1 uncharacterized protein DUF732 [Couchioplanes caeruleus]
MMTKWLAATALLLAMGGCGDDAAAEPATVPVPATSSGGTASTRTMVTESTTAGARAATTAAPRAPQTPTQARAAAGTGAFVEAVRDKLPRIALDHRDEEIAAIAEQACSSLAGGDDAGAIVAATRDLAGAAATDRATARRLVKLAIDTVCPDQDRRVDEF